MSSWCKKLDRFLGRSLALCAMIVLCAGAAGCVERTVRITSEPEGAIVWINHREVGRTPVEVGFVHYGDYDLRLEKIGFEPLVTNARVRAPLWDLPGPDFFAEILPIPLHSRAHVHLVLLPSDDPSLGGRSGLLMRATDLRGRTEALPRPVTDRESLMESLRPIRIRPGRDRDDVTIPEADLLIDDPFRD